MGAIVLDANRVNSYVLSNLLKSKNTIKNAYSTSNTLKNSLPNTFTYKNYISNIATQLYNIQKEISNINQIITKKIEKAKSIERSGQSRTSVISKMAATINGNIGMAAIGPSGRVSRVVNNAVVKNKISKTIANTGSKIVSKTVSKIKMFGSSISEGFKYIGSKATEAYETATNWISDKTNSISNWVSEKANNVSSWISEKFEIAKDWTCKALEDTGAFISDVSTTVWNWVTDVENWKKVGASIVTGVISLLKGIISLVEAIGDMIVILTAGVGTTGSALVDLGKGIATGNWDFESTKNLWKETKSIVSYQWTNKIFDAFYETTAGEWLNSYAYTPFKSDGIASQILEGIGYVAGVIAITTLTFGAGGVAIGATTTASSGASTAMAMTATFAGTGKYTAEEWNKNSISINYNGIDMNIAVDYEKYSQIEKLKPGETTTISQQIALSDGSIQELSFYITAQGDGKYFITDMYGNIAKLNNLNESSTAKGLLVGGIEGAWEGAQWFIGGKIGAGQFTKITGSVTSPILKTLIKSGIRVGLDTATGVAEVPFQSLVTMLSEGKSWEDAWNANGGWDAVKTQAGIAGLSSFAGEVFDLGSDKLFKKRSNEGKIDDASTPKSSNIPNNSVDSEAISYFYKDGRSAIKDYNEAFSELSQLKKIANTDEYKIAISGVKQGYAGNLSEIEKYLDIKRRIDVLEQKINILENLKSYSATIESITSIDMEKFESAFDICRKKFGEDEALARVKALVDPNNSQYGDYYLITSTGGARELMSGYTPGQLKYMLEHLRDISSKTNSGGIHQFFHNLDQYGVDQADVENLCTYIYDGRSYTYRQARDMVNEAIEDNMPIPKFKKGGSNAYFDLKDKLIKQGFSANDASVILSSLNDAGACSYASVCSEIFYQFRDCPDLFEEKFGYSMYKIINGKKALNSAELLVDLYTFANDTKNGGKFFTNGKINEQYLSNKIDVFGRNIIQSDKQEYMSGWHGKSTDIIDKFLKSKSKNFEFDSSIFINNCYAKLEFTDEAVTNIIKDLNEAIENGNSVSIGIYFDQSQNDKVIRMLSYDESAYSSIRTDSWSEGFGHSMAVTGTIDQGVCVSSWGRMYLIPYEDLFHGGKFIMTVDNIKNNIGG